MSLKGIMPRILSNLKQSNKTKNNFRRSNFFLFIEIKKFYQNKKTEYFEVKYLLNLVKLKLIKIKLIFKYGLSSF